MLTAETKAEIKRLFHAEHLTMNMIACKLSIHHGTVRQALEVERFHPHLLFRSSQLDEYVPFITSTLEEFPRLRSTRLFQMLADRGYQGSVQQLRRRVRVLRPKAARAYLPLTMFAGEQAQVDWGHFGTMAIGGATRRLSCFVMTLAYSRHVYARFCLDQSLESFLQNHIDGFRAIKGVPRVIRYDNLKTAVVERFGQAIRFNSALLDMAGYYRFRPSACNPYSGHEKGRVERTIRYIRDNFFAGRHFKNPEDANAQLRSWLDGVCNVRPWPDDRQRTVSDVWTEECDRLLPLPPADFIIDHPRMVRSGKIPYIRFDLNDYSIPYQLVQKPLSLMASEHLIRIFDGQIEVARHERCYDCRKKIRNDDHFSGLYQQKPGAAMNSGQAFLVQAVPETEELFTMMISQGLPLGAATRKLMELMETYGIQATGESIREAVARKCPRIPFIAMRLAERERLKNSPPAVPIILPDRPNLSEIAVTPHDLAAYDNLTETLSQDASTKEEEDYVNN